MVLLVRAAYLNDMETVLMLVCQCLTKKKKPPVVEQTSLQCSEVMNTFETQVPQVPLEEEVFHTSITSDPSTNVTDNSPDGLDAQAW